MHGCNGVVNRDVVRAVLLRDLRRAAIGVAMDAVRRDATLRSALRSLGSNVIVVDL